MSLGDVRQRIRDRLDEGDRGDRGWFIITRVHVVLAWLRGIAKYLDDRGGCSPIRLTPQDYRQLGETTECRGLDPGVELRRHHLLVMDKPLQLLRRVKDDSWEQVELTDRGRDLARVDDPAQVLESSLCEIRFAVEPWSPPQRVAEYAEFNVAAYRIARHVIERCDGYVDRDEFDFFLSRIRTDDEADWAIEGIHAYRGLAGDQQEALHTEVLSRIPGRKRYQNWRDVALHTFSLFSLGTTMIREGQRLLLASTWTRIHTAPSPTTVYRLPELRMPEPPDLEELLVPPSAPVSNSGWDGESFVAKVLRSQGWKVAFYTNRRGYGFDLWACRGTAAMVVEVKSSLGLLGAISLTQIEHQAAAEYGDNYVLALAENMDSDSPSLRMIQNPLAKMEVRPCESTSYVITRDEWQRAAALEP